MAQSSYSIDSATPLASRVETVTLIEGGTFLVCARDLSIAPGGMQGYFAADTRLISELFMTINGQKVFGLEHSQQDDCAEEIGVLGDPTRPSLLVRRQITLSAHQMAISVEITNLEATETDVLIDLTVDSDFADIFDVKRGECSRGGFVGAGPSNGALVLAYENRDFRRGLRIAADEPFEVLRDGLRVSRTISERSQVTVIFSFVPEVQRYQASSPLTKQACPVTFDSTCISAPGREGIIAASCRDLESLLIRDALTDEWVVAAGSPWFLALFGRDSLITSMQAMPLTVDLALNVLRALAVRQGRNVNVHTDEQPGRILHEVRAGEAVGRPGGWGDVYYGSVDATPLFIMTLAETLKWDAPLEAVRALMPAAESAYQWLSTFGDPDGDGLIEYPGRAVRTGLDNQAWKDSYDAIRHSNGEIADGPIAVVEVQGYKHAALLDLAFLRETLSSGDPEPLRYEAAQLRDRIHEYYWMEDESCFALALDGNKKRVGTVTSNAGHLLWTATAYEDVATKLAERLMEPDMFTGFGLRTMSSNNPGWNPLSYHCGTVWPHDSTIVATGMFRYGLDNLGAQLSTAILDAAACCSGRLPELFAGFDRGHFPSPVPYPSSCSPQAWSAGAPLMLARHM